MTSVRSSARTTFAALGIPNYRRYIGGQSVSLIGTWMQSVAQSWLVLQLTDSGTALGLVVALQTLPVLLLGPYGGVVADRVDKRRLMIGLQSVMGVLALALGLLTITGLVQLWQVFLLAFLLGLNNCFENPARQSFILEMVGPEHLRNAVSLNSVMVNVARAVGPAVAGIVIAVGGTGICFLLNAASFVAVVVSLMSLDRSRLQPSPPAARAPGQLREGLAYVRRTPELAVPLLMMALVGCLAFEFQIVLPVVARQTFSGGSESYGLITAAMGAGAVVGGLLVAGRGRTGAKAMVRNALLFGGALVLAAAAPSLPVELVAIAVVGGMSVAFQSTGNSTLQLAASPSMRGRVMALWAVAFLGSTPIGGPIAGFVSDQLGGRGGLALGALACVLAAGLGAVLLRRGRAVEREGTENAPLPRHEPDQTGSSSLAAGSASSSRSSGGGVRNPRVSTAK
jgi:MFS family permease